MLFQQASMSSRRRQSLLKGLIAGVEGTTTARSVLAEQDWEDQEICGKWRFGEDISGKSLHSFTRGNYWIKRKAEKKSNVWFKGRKKQVFIHRLSSKSWTDLNSDKKKQCEIPGSKLSGTLISLSFSPLFLSKSRPTHKAGAVTIQPRESVRQHTKVSWKDSGFKRQNSVLSSLCYTPYVKSSKTLLQVL